MHFLIPSTLSLIPVVIRVLSSPYQNNETPKARPGLLRRFSIDQLHYNDHTLIQADIVLLVLVLYLLRLS